MFVIFFLCVTFPVTSSQFADFQFACPAWGCSARGTFSWPTPPPSGAPTVRWTKTWNQTTDRSLPNVGCSTSLSTVSCVTANGVATLVTASGYQKWVMDQKTKMTPQFLPLVDYFGHVIVTDSDDLTFVTPDGRPRQPVSNISGLTTQFGPVISDISRTVLLTSPQPDHPQLLAYNVLGQARAATQLRDTLGGYPGRFVPRHHPIIDGERAYVVTTFVPDDPNHHVVTPPPIPFRLFAIDLSGNASDNTVAWHVDLVTTDSSGRRPFDYTPYCRAAVYNKTVYILGYTMNSALYAVKDLGSSAKLLFQAPATDGGGSMAIYDREHTWTNITASGVRPVWVTTQVTRHSRNDLLRITGFDPDTGKVLTAVDVNNVTGSSVCRMTSDLHVTRQAEHTDRDVLVLAVQDAQAQAHVLAIEAGLPPLTPRLLWEVNVSEGHGQGHGEGHGHGQGQGHGEGEGQDSSSWEVAGQIASAAVLKEGGGFGYGLVVSVSERSSSSVRSYVKMIA